MIKLDELKLDEYEKEIESNFSNQRSVKTKEQFEILKKSAAQHKKKNL